MFAISGVLCTDHVNHNPWGHLMSNLTQSTVNRLKSIKLLFSAALTLLMYCLGGFNVSAQDKIPFGSSDTLEEIQAKIQHNGYSFTVGHNWVFDLTPEEKARMFPARSAPVPGSSIPTPNTDLVLKQTASSLPSKLDWRNVDGHSYIGPIRNQGKSCACVTFGCVDAASLSYNVKYGLYDENCAVFSVMYLLWTLGPILPQYGNFGYSGGTAEYNQFYALMKTGGSNGAVGFEGTCSEANFPFVESGVSPPPDMIERSKTYPRVTFKNWIRVMPVNYADTTEQIKAAIAAHGSVAVQVAHGSSAFLAYKSGIYEDTNTLPDVIPYYRSVTNHGVSLVGWDDNPPEGGGGCWILRNEWGTGWGEGGYMRIRYFSAKVNVAAACAVAGESPGQYAIRGSVKCSEWQMVATMSLTGSDTSSIMTDGDNKYSLGNLAAGTYTVTPSSPGYSFDPQNRTVALPFGIDGDFNECNFTATMTGPVLLTGVSPENKGNTYPPVGQAPFQKDQWTLLYVKTADVCYAFKEWKIVGDAELKYDKSVAVNEVRLSGNASATAVFEYKGPPDHVDMTISPYDHGTGTVTPAEGTYPVGYNVPVSIDASPAAGRYFGKWQVYSGYESKATVKDIYQHATTVKLTGDAVIHAQFFSINKEVRLAMAVSPLGSGFTVPLSGSTAIVPGGSNVDIEAIPADGYYFDNWTASRGGNSVKFNNVYNSKTQVFLQVDVDVTANFKKIEKTASLTLAVSPDSSGTTNPAVGAHTVPVGAHTEIEALPADGYFFVSWTGIGAADMEDPYSAKTLVTISGDTTVTANFAKIVNTATLTMSASPYSPFNPESGTNPGLGDHVLPVGAWTDIEAVPGDGYYFDCWTATEKADVRSLISKKTSVMISGNATVTANFKPTDATAVLTLKAAPDASGSTNPGTGEQTVAVGERVEIEAVPADGYFFTEWTSSGNTKIEDANSDTTSVVLSGNATVTANFAKILKTATLTLAVTPRNSGSTNPGGGTHVVPVGAHTEIKAIPAAGYYFEKWTVSGGAKVTGSAESGWKATLTAKGTVTAKFTYFKDATVTSDTYAVGTVGGSSRTIAAVPSGTAKAVFLANLAKGQADQTWNDKGIANPVVSGNTLVVTAADKRTKITYKVYDFTVNASTGSGGSISPAGELPVNYNASKSFKMTPDSRHNMQNVVVDGETVGPVRNYTFKNVTENHTILAIFAIKTFTLTYNTTPNGAPIPAQTVNYGADGTTVTAVPNPGYRFVKWSDGVRTASRTDTDITANKTVTANFAVGKFPATVTLADLSQMYNGTPRQVTATTAPAGLNVNIKYNGSANAPVNAGSYPVTATVVSDIYAGVQTGTLVISKGAQTIIFEPLPDKVYGAANFAPGATASSVLAVTYASTNTDVAKIIGSRIHITGAGTSIITAMQDGNANWNAAPEVSQPLTVAPNAPTYPIAADVYTTLEKTLVPIPLPKDAKPLLPCEVSEYAVNGYGLFNPPGGPAPFVRPDMQTNAVIPSVRDPLAATLLTFFSLSDTHLTDKESPAQCIYYGYEAGPLSNSSAYSAIILYTTHVLDAAIQTINVLNKRTPFDFGIDLGDAVNNNQYNELRWFIDVVDGQKITPSSGAHIGGKTIDYQKPYQAAGLDKSINWYQVMGNHDPFWTGCLLADDYIKETIVSSSVLNLGSSSATYAALDLRGFYMGLVDGSTKYGDIIDVGPVEYYLKPPKVVADRDRRSLSVRDWMGEFLNSTTLPAGHGITQEMINDGLVRYSFHPRSDIPLKVIVLDDIDKGGSANGTLDYQRYDWLVSELDAGEAAGELMIVCAHIPVHPYAPPSPPAPPPTNNPYYPYYSLFATYSMISEEALLQKLWTYQNLIMWVSGHVHRNAITNQPPAAPTPSVPSPFYGDLTHAFWEVETPSLRDFPQQFRHFEIVRNSDNNISIFALDVDPAVKAPAEVGASAPAWTSRSYALACHQIYQVPVQQGPNVDQYTGVYNAELVKHLSPAMQAKLALLFPNVSSFQINGNASSTKSQTVALNNSVAGTTPAQYMASESSDFSGAAWLPYSNAPVFILSSGAGTKTVYLKVKDGSGTESGVVSDSIVRH